MSVNKIPTFVFPVCVKRDGQPRDHILHCSVAHNINIWGVLGYAQLND